MRRSIWVVLVALVVVPGLLFTTACSKKQIKEESKPGAAADSSSVAKPSAGKEDDAAAKRAEEERLRKQREEQERLAKMGGAREKFVNEDIYFDYDKANIRSDAEPVLKDKAQFLKANADVAIIIEGHCDERGTNEYNMALGDRRAQSAKKYLMNLGIAGSRMETISYGEEKPVDPGHSEAAWAKNRRAHFVIK